MGSQPILILRFCRAVICVSCWRGSDLRGQDPEILRVPDDDIVLIVSQPDDALKTARKDQRSASRAGLGSHVDGCTRASLPTCSDDRVRLRMDHRAASLGVTRSGRDLLKRLQPSWATSFKTGDRTWRRSVVACGQNRVSPYYDRTDAVSCALSTGGDSKRDIQVVRIPLRPGPDAFDTHI